MKMDFYIGRAIEVKNDEYHGDLIKVRIDPEDTKRLDKDIPYAFPLLPKMLHIKPKVGEAVGVLVDPAGFRGAQRYYIGPIISQPQKMWKEPMNSATSLLRNGQAVPRESIDNRSESLGTMPEDEDIAILGRKDTDIILTDDEIKLRAGVRVTDPAGRKIEFNRDSPAFIKLKYHQDNIENDFSWDLGKAHSKTNSTATIFADKINLISPSGDGWDSLEYGENAGELITDEKMKSVIEKAHQLPYGDVLCDFFEKFLMAYSTHSHPSPGAPPILGGDSTQTFYSQYGKTKESIGNKILSKDIRIN